MTPLNPSREDATTARLLLVALAFCWGLSWPAMRIALEEVSPWTLRVIGFSLGTVCLFAWAVVAGRSLKVKRPRDWAHLTVGSLLNVVAFGVFSTFGQLNTSTSRVIIVCYSLPVWASLLAWLVLGERIGLRAAIGLVLCVLGLAVLVVPELNADSVLGLSLGLGCAVSWAAGTVYLKWAQIDGDLVALTAWQIALGAVVMVGMMFVFQGPPTFEPLMLRTWLAIAYSGIIGTGVAYVIWFTIVDKVSAATASLGSLANPVVGIIGAMILLHERPTGADMVGFALIFAAAVCVLLQPRATTAIPPANS